ncbi:MAG TPA: AraC family transcriptional regulator [Woeseiaceae bacterium]|nr:AraC family transcriptional regulator [Woeseiaceae bacterium]
MAEAGGKAVKTHVGGVVPGGYGRVSEILALVPLLKEFGVDLGRVLHESGLPADQFNDPENLIPFRDGSHLIGLCADQADCPHFGLLMGQYTSLDALGIVAEMARAAPDVRAAIRLIGRYLTLSDGGGLVELSEGPLFAQWGYALYEPGVERPELIYDCVLANCWNIMRTLCGAKWSPVEIVFTRRAPPDLQPYREFFSAPLRFDAEHSALVFRSDWLNTPLPTSNPARLLLLEKQVRDLEARSTGDLPAQVRRVLRRHLLSGSTSLRRVADDLAVHPRTLDRRLEAHGISFRSLIDEVRFEVSCQLLATRLPILTIAQSLQYANPAAFTRAFRRWSRTTPRQWRASLLASAEKTSNRD